MKEQFCTYEIALQLKEFEFDEPCFGFYVSNVVGHAFTLIQNGIGYKTNSELTGKTHISAPLWQQVIDWFRNLHGVIIEVYIPRDIPYEYNFAIYYPDELTKNHLNEKYFNEIIYDYNVAREIAILKAIELCKKKQ